MYCRVNKLLHSSREENTEREVRPMAKDQTETRKPDFKERVGTVSIALWKRENSGFSGELQRGYKVGNDWINEKIHIFPGTISELETILASARKAMTQ
jgi:hypothetical protein